MRIKSFGLLTALCLLLFSQVLYAAPDLIAGQRDAVRGATVSIPFDWVNDGSVVALQFDLVFDVSVLNISNVSAGAAGAGHTLDWQVVGAGRLRVVFSTPVMNVITSGNLVNVDIAVASNAAVGEYPLIIENPLFANDQARPVVPTSVVSGEVNVLDALPPLDPAVPIPGLGWFAMLVLIGILAGLGWLTISRGPKNTLMSVFLGGLLFSSTLVQAATLPGDANNDGKVDTSDIPVIVAQILERQQAPGDPDCNRDSKVNVLDTVCAAQSPAENQAPVLAAIANQQTVVDQSFSLTAVAVDPDQNDVVNYSLDQSPAGMLIGAANGVISWTPGDSQLGINDVTVRASDQQGLFDVEAFQINVVEIITNNPPTLIPPGNRQIQANTAFSTTLFATDPDAGDVLTFSLAGAPAGMNIDPASGQLTWTPSGADLGSKTVTAGVTDSGGLQDAETFAVTVILQPAVADANSPPELTVPGNQNMVLGNLLATQVSATDADNDPLVFELVNAPAGMSIDSVNGSINWTPTADQVGAFDVAVKVSDTHGAADFGSFIVTVIHVNRPPVATDDVYQVRIGDTLSIAAPGMLDNDSDPDNDPLTASLVSSVAKGNLDFRSDGSFDYTPDEPTSNASVELEVQCEIGKADGGNYMHQGTLAVGDVDNDGELEIVGIGGLTGYSFISTVWIISASDCSPKLNTSQEVVDGGGAESYSHPGLLDIDGDGDLEIIVVRGRFPLVEGGNFDGQHLMAIHHDGTLAWPGNGGTATSASLTPGQLGYTHTGPTFADLDGDGTVEILMIGNIPGVGHATSRHVLTVYNSVDGSIKWEHVGEDYRFRADVQPPVVADLNLDGKMEVILHTSVIDHQGNTKFLLPTELRDGQFPHLLSAVANFDSDPYPEIVARDRTHNYLFKHDGSLIWKKSNPNTSRNQIAVADFDGDGEVEFAYTQMNGGFSGYIIVYDNDGSVLWSHEDIPELESVFANSGENITAFDANGDGAVDIIIHLMPSAMDKRGVYIVDGREGSILHFELIRRYSINQRFLTIADVDGDGQAELMTSFNSGPSGGVTRVWQGTAAYPLPPAPPLRNQWVFNQTMVRDDATIISNPTPAWLQPGHNGYNLVSSLGEFNLAGTTDSFTYKASDGELESNLATVSFDVQPDGVAPVFLSEPDTLTTVGFQYQYAPRVVDYDPGDTVSFMLTEAPNGMTIDPVTGITRWLPDANGSYSVIVLAFDTIGFATPQAYTLMVGNPVTVPDVIGQPVASAETTLTASNLLVGRKQIATHPTIAAGSVSVQAPVAGSVAEFGSSVNLTVSAGPGPEDIDNDGDGFTPNEGDCNDNDASIKPGATDAAGDGIDQDCDGIDGNLTLAEILVLPKSSTVLTNQSVKLKAIGIFEDGTSQNLTGVVSWSDDPDFKSATAGNFTVTATRGSVSGAAEVHVVARVSGDTVPPVAEIATPVTGDTITAPIDVTGTATDANFLKYELAYAVAGSDDFAVFASNTSPVSNGVLGQLDPTLLINDLYTVRLTVIDLGGNQLYTEITLQVDGNLKVGNFTLSFTDLAIPMAGIPITVTRTYDSREKRSGDFGVGWFLDFNTIRLSTNRVPGTGWHVLKSGLYYVLVPTDAHTVSLTFQDGRVEAFDMVVSPSNSPIVPFPPLNQTVSFTPRPGTLGQLKSLDGNFVSILDAQPGPVDMRRDSDGKIYDPQRFRYTAVDGTQIDIRKSDGIERIVDLNGNTLTFGPGGIIHSAGKSVTFQRDAQGRITEITDPAGNTQAYVFDANGDLTSHKDTEGNSESYKYNYYHGLLSVTDRLGNTITSNEFDGDGRLIATFDAQGNQVGFQHELIIRTSTITDPDGRDYTVQYDDHGNIIRSIDALGNESLATFDVNGNVTSRTNPLGETISFEYNGQNKETRRTNGEGHATNYSYDANGQLLSVTDAKGNVTQYLRDSRGNVTQEIDPSGNVTGYAYDAKGNLVLRKDARGYTSQYEYDAFGNMIDETDNSGTLRSYTYDANGRLLTSGIEVMQADGTMQPITITNVLDKRGNVLQWSDDLGNSASATFDANGQMLTTTNVLGQTAGYVYNANGLLTEAALPDGTSYTHRYTADSKVAETTGPGGRVTMMDYGQSGLAASMVDQNDPGDLSDDAIRELNYDAASRLVQLEGPTGTQRGYRYDDSGRIVGVSSGSLELYTSVLDAAGEVISTTDANGGVTTFNRDALKRPVQRQLPDGRTINTTYDVSGNIASVTEVGGDSISYGYDEMNRLVGVELGGANTTYQYDNVGRLVSMTDGLGREAGFRYSLGSTNQLFVTRPLGQEIKMSLDAMGNLTRLTNPDGSYIEYQYDNMNRRVSKTLSSGETSTYTYTADGKPSSINSPSGNTELFYNNQGLLERQVDPLGFELEYEYDRVGRVASITTPSGTTNYIFNSDGLLASVTDQLGETTSYEYDPLGNLLEKTLPNGTRELSTYDVANQLTQIQHVAADNTVLRQYTYDIGSGGRYNRVTELSGRTVEFEYDNQGRLVQEYIQGSIQPDRTISYAYDAVGNRLSKTDSVSGVTTYTYNENDQLLSRTTGSAQTNYGYDANGNLVSESSPTLYATYQWSVDGRLLGANITDNGVNKVVTYQYDHRGNRIAEVVNGQRVRYLVDANRQYAQVLEEVSELDVVTASYVYDDSVLSRHTGGNNFYYLDDGHSGVRSVQNATEQVVNEYDYDAFGRTLSASEGITNPYQYRGERLDGALSQYYLRARVYDQHTGRFLSADPDPGTMDTPISQHHYLYAHGNPVLYSDPSGRAVDMKSLMIGMAIVGTLGAMSQQAIGIAKGGTIRDIKWEGPNIFFSIGIKGKGPEKKKGAAGIKMGAGVGFDPGITLQKAKNKGRVTDAVNLVLTASIGAEISIDSDNESLLPQAGGSTGGQIGKAFFYVFGILPQTLPIGVSTGDATLHSQAALGGANGINPDIALSGFYAQLAISASAPTIFAPLFKGVNAIGSGGVLQGFAAGFSSVDMGLGSAGFSAGIGLNGGFSISLTPSDQINQPGK